MKILMTSETFLPSLGGAEIHVANLLKHVQGRHDIVLVTNEADAESVQAAFPRVRLISISWSRTHLPGLIRVLWRESKNADIIHAHYSYRLAALVGIIGILRRVPVVVTLHGLGTLDEAGARFLYKQVHALYRRISLGAAKRIISTSEDLATVAARYCSSAKMIVIPNGYDAERFHSDIVPSPELAKRFEGNRVVLSVRRLVPKNGIHYLIEAMPYVIKKNPDVRCVCVGDGRMRSYIESRIDALGLRDYVVLAGAVENSLVPDYLALAHVVVFPSTAESASIACAEAMGSGAPVVASRVGGLIELIGADSERGRLVTLVDWTESNYDAPLTLPPERYEALANAICESLSEGRSNERSRAAAAYAERELAWPVIAKRTLEQYDMMLRT